MEWEVGYRPGVPHVLKLLLSLGSTSASKARHSAAGHEG